MSFPSKPSIFGFILFSFSISLAQAKDLSSVDSIGVQRVGDKTFIVHQVSEQETLFSISRRYKVGMGDIQGANQALKQGLKVGETILVPHGQATASISAPISTPATSPVASSPVITAPVEVASPPVAIVAVAAATPAVTPSPSPAAAATEKPKPTTKISTITHKVKSGESLYVVAKKYNVSIKDLKTWNSLKADKVTVGQSLKIQRTVVVTDTATPAAATTASAAASPKKEEVKKEEPKKEEPKKEEKLPAKKEGIIADKKVALATANSTLPGDWIAHTVKSGESLFSLSKEYGSSIEALIEWNALSSNNLKVGQSIKVGRVSESTDAKPTAAEAETTTAVSSPVSTTMPERSSRQTASPASASTSPATVTPGLAATTNEAMTAPNTSGGFSNNKEMGLAELIPNTSGNKKYLVLHRTAPVGSVIRVKNEENDITIFARVVGVLPETGDNSKLLIKLSQAAFDQLKAVNQRFPVEILY